MSTRVHIDDPDERQRWIEGRRERLELVREAGWGQVSWLSVAAGVLTALGVFALCVGIAAAVLHPLGITTDDLTDSDWKRLGLGAGLAGAAALLSAYAFGGYVAGRMARRAGLRHGVLVFVIGLIVLAAGIGIAQFEDGISAIRDRVESLGAPTGDSAWTGVGLVTGVVAVAGMLLGALLGGVRGERWHQRLVARALDPDIGPEAELRADVEAQRRAAAKAMARARKAGVLPADDTETEPVLPQTEPADAEPARATEDTEGSGSVRVVRDGKGDAEGATRGEPEPTGAGRPMPPSSWSSGP